MVENWPNKHKKWRLNTNLGILDKYHKNENLLLYKTNLLKNVGFKHMYSERPKSEQVQFFDVFLFSQFQPLSTKLNVQNPNDLADFGRFRPSKIQMTTIETII